MTDQEIEAKDAEIAELNERIEELNSWDDDGKCRCCGEENISRFDAEKRRADTAEARVKELLAKLHSRNKTILALKNIYGSNESVSTSPQLIVELNDRIAELEDLLKRSNKAARLEDLSRIAALERELAVERKVSAAMDRQVKAYCAELIDARTDLQGNMDAVAELRHELAEAKEDTERLDWLESNQVVEAGYLLINGAISTFQPFEWLDENGDTLRSAIDKAKEQS